MSSREKELIALRQTATLWKKVEEDGIATETDKYDLCKTLFGDMLNGCPCCEFTSREVRTAYNVLITYMKEAECSDCPIWGQYSQEESFACCSMEYGKWVTANEENSPELAKSFARDIRILAENRIEEIENEKVSSCCRSSGESPCSCRD